MKKLLKEYFGYDNFRPLQQEIIESVLEGHDSFVLMPTGGGKSLCYQLPALKLNGLTLVISPLIALMKDQVDALKANGIKAEFINSSLNKEQIEKITQKIKKNEIDLLYIAPERFALPDFQQFLTQLNINLIAVDEAHCISEWGHDFRPDYRNLSVIKKLFPEIPLTALTATATVQVQSDILKHLNIPKAQKFVSSFNRENLNLSVVNKKRAFPKLVTLLQNYKNESVIIYCFSRRDTEDIAENLRLNGFSARAYHAGLETHERKLAQEAFVKDQADIIVATIAFGMGIDKPDVRLVVHYTFPKTLEGYYQEIGRAGRDGLPSDCVMFYTYADLRKHEYFVDKIEDTRLREQTLSKLNEVLTYAELSSCRKKHLLRYFGEEMKSDNCGACDSCLNKNETFDATKIAQKIMSTVLRTDSRFGRNYIIDVLLGKQTQKIKQNKHNELSVFGIVSDKNEEELGQIIKQLLDQHFILKSSGKYPILNLSKEGKNALNDKLTIELQVPTIDIKPTKPKPNELDYNPDLFKKLRELRKQIALEAKVPPFVIFGDKSLQEMAFYLPQNQDSFSRINGVGVKKLEEYSKIFINLINSFAQDQGLSPIDIPGESNFGPQIIKRPKEKYFCKTKELIDKKIPLDRIAKKQNIKITTAINHIEKLLDVGEKIDVEYLKLPQDKYQTISTAFTECGDEKLKPVFEFLNGKYSYDEIRLIRVLLKT